MNPGKTLLGYPARKMAGFTLIEVLVALAIVAISLAAGVQATASLARNAERQSDLLLAQLCADNALSAIRLARQMPPVGINTVACEQAGQTFNSQLSVQPTPNPNFLRVESRIFKGDNSVLVLSTVVGRY